MEKDANEGLYGLIICNSQLSRKERRVGLVAVDVRARGDDFCSHVTVCQEYVNKSHGPIDTKYVFPLPEDGSLIVRLPRLAVCTSDCLVCEQHRSVLLRQRSVTL